MIIFVKLVGVAVTALGLGIFVSPKFSQKLFDFFNEGIRIYFAGAIRVLVGAAVLFVASRSAVPVAAAALGIMFLVSGIAVFAADLEKTKAFILHYSQMPPLVIRLLGLIAASFGVFIISLF